MKEKDDRVKKEEWRSKNSGGVVDMVVNDVDEVNLVVVTVEKGVEVMDQPQQRQREIDFLPHKELPK